MTGLETAIILIAFVTVAAVFGYAVLSAGLFSAERGKETIYAGLQQAKANMEVSGSVIVMSTNQTATTVKITVRNAIAGTPIDMTPPIARTPDGHAAIGGPGTNRCVLSLTTATDYENNIEWATEPIGSDDGDALLEAGEQLEITIDLAALKDANHDALTITPLGVNSWFNIQVKPTQGSTMTIQRTLPAGLDDIMDMH
jgi:flagellin FlaB